MNFDLLVCDDLSFAVIVLSVTGLLNDSLSESLKLLFLPPDELFGCFILKPSTGFDHAIYGQNYFAIMLVLFLSIWSMDDSIIESLW
jgi:hypothetical protein